MHHRAVLTLEKSLQRLLIHRLDMSKEPILLMTITVQVHYPLALAEICRVQKPTVRRLGYCKTSTDSQIVFWGISRRRAKSGKNDRRSMKQKGDERGLLQKIFKSKPIKVEYVA